MMMMMVDDVSGAVSFEYGFGLRRISKISVFGTKEYELFFFPGIFFRYEFNSSSNQTATPGYQNDLFLSRHCKIWAKIRIFFMYTWLSNSCLHHNNVEITEMKKNNSTDYPTCRDVVHSIVPM